jgi:hypothetical protein
MTAAAKRTGISRAALYEWKAADPIFARDLDAAYDEGTDIFADALMERALLPDHDGLAIFLLKQRDPKRFNQKMVELQVSGGVNVSHNNGAMIYPRAELQRPKPTELIEAIIEPEPDEQDPDETLEATTEIVEEPPAERPDGWRRIKIPRS